MRWVLDTHVALWNISDSRRLGPNASAALFGCAPSDLVLSDISLSEVARLLAARKIGVPGDAAGWLVNFADCHTVVPVTARVAYLAAHYSFAHRDPSDRHILATAATLGLPLVTIDKELTKAAATVGVRVVW